MFDEGTDLYFKNMNIYIYTHFYEYMLYIIYCYIIFFKIIIMEMNMERFCMWTGLDKHDHFRQVIFGY